jgi:hypothetical protein
VFNQGSFTISNMSFANPNDAGYNLIGNPYPSTIDWNLVTSKTNVTSTIWVWNPNTYSYGTYDGVASVNGGSRYIPACQGFFVKVNNSSNSLTLNNSVRVSQPQTFLKGDSKLSNAIKLQLTDGKYSDEALVYFAQETDGSPKLYSFSSAVPQLFIKEGTQNFAISHYSGPIANRDVHLALYINQSGKYTINVADFTFDNNVNVSLEDLVSKKTTILNGTSSYSFDFATGSESNRFVLHFSNKSVTAIETVSDNTPKIYSFGKQIYISNTAAHSGEIAVYDLLGRLILQKSINTAQDQIDMSYQPAGIYMVQVSVLNQVFTQKLVLE